MTTNPRIDVDAAASLGELHRALVVLATLVDAWTATAETTRAKEGADERRPDAARYARGVAGGLNVAASQLADHIPVLLAAIPPCPHGTSHDQNHCPGWCW